VVKVSAHQLFIIFSAIACFFRIIFRFCNQVKLQSWPRYFQSKAQVMLFSAEQFSISCNILVKWSGYPKPVFSSKLN